MGSAGWFAVLRANVWFAASRLPDRFQYPNGRPKGGAGLAVPERTALNDAHSQKTTMPLQLVLPSAPDRRVVRHALIVLAAIAVTSLLLWWIMAGAPSNRY